MVEGCVKFYNFKSIFGQPEAFFPAEIECFGDFENFGQ
jgi:hypothetical protein